MIGNKVLVPIVVLTATACMTAVSPQGAKIRVVTAEQKEGACQSLGLLSASEAMGSSTSGDAQSAMNKVRNKVADIGGNAMVILSTNTDIFATTISVEALSCNLDALRQTDDKRYDRIPLHHISVGDSKRDVEEALGAPENVIGAKQYEEGIVEVWSYQRWDRSGVEEVMVEEYWIYFWNGNVTQWGRPGDWREEADQIYEIRIR